MAQTQTSQARPTSTSPAQQANAMPQANTTGTNQVMPAGDANVSQKPKWLWWVIGILALIVVASLIYFFI